MKLEQNILADDDIIFATSVKLCETVNVFIFIHIILHKSITTRVYNLINISHLKKLKPTVYFI